MEDLHGLSQEFLRLNGSVRSGKAPAQSATTRTPEKRPAPQICHSVTTGCKRWKIYHILRHISYILYMHIIYIYIAYWIVSMDKHGVHFLCQAAIAPRASCRIKVPEGWSCQRNSQCISAILNKSFSQSFCVFSQNRSKIIYDHLWSKMIIRWSLRCQWMSHTDMMSPWDPWIHGPSNHVAPPSKDTLMVTGPAGCGGAMQRSLTASISENLII